MEVAHRLLAKLRNFVVEELDEKESEMFATLLAPGVSLAYSDDDVLGFGAEWRPGALAGSLSEALREGGVRVVGLRG